MKLSLSILLLCLSGVLYAEAQRGRGGWNRENRNNGGRGNAPRNGGIAGGFAGGFAGRFAGGRATVPPETDRDNRKKNDKVEGEMRLPPAGGQHGDGSKSEDRDNGPSRGGGRPNGKEGNNNNGRDEPKPPGHKKWELKAGQGMMRQNGKPRAQMNPQKMDHKKMQQVVEMHFKDKVSRLQSLTTMGQQRQMSVMGQDSVQDTAFKSKLEGEIKAELVGMQEDRILVVAEGIDESLPANLTSRRRRAAEDTCSSEVRQAACDIIQAYNDGVIYVLPFVVSDQRYSTAGSPLTNVVEMCNYGRPPVTTGGGSACPAAATLRAAKLIAEATRNEVQSGPIYISAITGGSREYLTGVSAAHKRGSGVDFWCNMLGDYCLELAKQCAAHGGSQWMFPAESVNCPAFSGNSDSYSIDSVHCTLS